MSLEAYRGCHAESSLSLSHTMYAGRNAQSGLYGNRSIEVIPKTPAFVIGERVVGPLLRYSGNFMRGAWSGFGSLASRISNFIPNFPVASAEADKFHEDHQSSHFLTSRANNLWSNFTAYVANVGISTVTAINTTTN